MTMDVINIFDIIPCACFSDLCPHIYGMYSRFVAVQSSLLRPIIQEADKSLYIILSSAGIMTLMTVDFVMSSPDLVDPCNSTDVSLLIFICMIHEVGGSLLSVGISVGSLSYLV